MSLDPATLGQVYATVTGPAVSRGLIRISWEDVILLGVLVLYGAYWGHALRAGEVLGQWGLRAHILLYVCLGVWVWFTTVYAWVSANYAPNSTANAEVVFALLGWFVIPFVFAYAGHAAGMRMGMNRVVVRRLAERIWMVQGRAPVWAWWLFIWVVRWLIEDLSLKGYSVFLPFQPVPNVAAPLFIGLVLFVGALYLFSFGLMIGFSRAVLRLYHGQRSAPYRTDIAPPSPSG